MTPTASTQSPLSVGFYIDSYTINNTPTPTASVTASIRNQTQVIGAVTFEILQNIFNKNTYVSKLVDCFDGSIYYSSSDLFYNNTPIYIGQIIKIFNNGNSFCFTFFGYETGSPNIFIENILAVYDNCDNCIPQKTIISENILPLIVVSPTPTPTPSLTKNLYFIFESCTPILGNILNTRLIQTSSYGAYLNTNQIVKDDNLNCWTFVGAYPNTYISFGNFIDYTYNGNYFNNISTIYENCENCLNG
jgi:hypothetical protein